jgi:hypothetical protein
MNKHEMFVWSRFGITAPVSASLSDGYADVPSTQTGAWFEHDPTASLALARGGESPVCAFHHGQDRP